MQSFLWRSREAPLVLNGYVWETMNEREREENAEVGEGSLEGGKEEEGVEEQ